MSSNNVSSLRNQLLAQGYSVMPNRGKVPVLPKWNDPGHVPARTSPKYPTLEACVASWERRFPEALSTGLLICDGLVVIDVDVDDATVVSQLWQSMCEIAPDVMMGPIRYGASADKMAVFCRLNPADEPFVRLASARYGGHQVEIFGGKKLRGDKVSRQFSVYGPHSYHEDGSVKAEYLWDHTGPALHELAAADLPVIKRTQCAAIIDAFDAIATAAGWQVDTQPDAGNDGGAVYDIDDTTRFNTDKGGHGIDYAELCDQYEAYGELRCSSSFIAERDGKKIDRCRVSWSFRHGCVAVWLDGDRIWHCPKDKQLDTAVIGEAIQGVADAAGVEIPEGAPNWRERYAGGGPKASIHNARLAIEAAGIVCSEDIFHGKLYLGRGSAGGKLLAFMGEMTDAGIRGMRFWLSDRYWFDLTEQHVREAALALARENAFDPVLEMLSDAEASWDGVARLNRMAVDHFNAEDTPLNRQCVRKTMIAAVARARQPGCKFDTILVMESKEGWNKSSSWAVLAGEGNFSDASIIGHNSREVQEQLGGGVWIHENPELAGLRKAEVEMVKAFASRQEDRARPAYGRFMVVQPRRSIEVGTTNGDEYLQSQTGNRRFWPIKVMAPIDLRRLRAARLQLWGEAAYYQSQGEALTLDEDLWPVAGVEQEKRRVRDPWEALLTERLTPAVADGTMSGLGNGIVHVVNDEWRVATSVIFRHLLEVTAGQLHNGHSKRLADCMRAIGWTNGLFKLDGRVTRGYVKVARYQK